MIIYLDIISKKDKDRQKVIDLFEKYAFENIFSTYYETDIRKIRKLKIANLEGNNEFSELIKYLFDKNHVEFMKNRPYYETGSTGTSGYSGSLGSSGTSGSPKFIDEIEETEKELDEKFFNEIFGTSGVQGTSGVMGKIKKVLEKT